MDSLSKHTEVRNTFTLPAVVGDRIDPQGDFGQVDFNAIGRNPMFSCSSVCMISSFQHLASSGRSIIRGRVFEGDFSGNETYLLGTKLKSLSEQKFKKMGKEPLVKEILVGSVKMKKEDIVNRIESHIRHLTETMR